MNEINNPVLTGFHPDPAICYINDTFYIANSTFEYYPGVALSKSKDLANWEKVGYPLKHNKHINMVGFPNSCGIWAPCLTHNNGRSYLVYTEVVSFDEQNDAHNYITYTDDIESDDWSEPVYINSSGFDPSLFHDDDGKKYFVNMEWDYRKEAGNPKFTGILVTELDKDTLKPIKEPVKVFEGSELGLVEGPHIYKKDGYYYMFTAEGGTSYHHAETVARSKNIYGPYELMPNTPHLITAKDDKSSYLQKTGHGSLCEDKNGRWWFAFLCGRPLENTIYCPLGRETGITEVEWIDGWPRIKEGGTVPNKKFIGYGEQKPLNNINLNFSNKEVLNKEFQSLRRPAEYDILQNGNLRLYGKEYLKSRNFQNMLVTRQRHFDFVANTCVINDNNNYKLMGGLIYRYSELNQYYLRFAYDEDVDSNVLQIITIRDGVQTIHDEKIKIAQNKVHLKLKVSGKSGKFYYSLDGEIYESINYHIDVTILSDEFDKPMGFTGAFVGMIAQDLQYNIGHCDFEYFNYKEK